ncbi:MAG: PEP-CTERM sorting domain-containing protein [Armatimonadetes bacterium]|nr:PEP-CTERM sorting domain-containing protein [Armatimonadota bacterium]
MRKCILSLTLLLMAVVFSAGYAWSDDLHPPPWRGQPGTTFAAWEFLTPDPNALPDQMYNPNGVPAMQIWTGIEQHWFDQWEGRIGVWPLSGALEVLIPNYPPPNPYKDIWIQITWAPQVPDVTPFVKEKISGTLAQLVSQTPFPGTPWVHSVYAIRLFPNPTHEIVRIDGGIMVDELVIDTICIPEPSSLLALSGSVLALVAWRRRR